MATATKTPTKAAASKAAVKPADDEATRARRNPVSTFEIVEELPEPPKRKAAEGFGTSKWVAIVAKVAAEVPTNAWVKVQEYVTGTGGRNAVLGLADDSDLFPALDGGLVWLCDDRRIVTGEGEDAVTTSALYMGKFDPESEKGAAAIAAVNEKNERLAAAKAKREATMKENGTKAGRPTADSGAADSTDEDSSED